MAARNIHNKIPCSALPPMHSVCSTGCSFAWVWLVGFKFLNSRLLVPSWHSPFSPFIPSGALTHGKYASLTPSAAF